MLRISSVSSCTLVSLVSKSYTCILANKNTAVIVPTYGTLYIPPLPFSLEMNILTPQTSILLFRSDHSQNTRLLDDRDPTTHSPTSRSSPSALSPLSLPIRPSPPPFPIHRPRLPTHHNGPRDPDDRPPRFPRAILRHLSSRNGGLLRRSRRHLLVRYEFERAHAKEHWHRVDD